MTEKPRSAAEINRRREQIGAELAKGRIVPVRNARALEAEDDALRIAYGEALEREAAAARDAAEVARRVEQARKEKLAQERERRIQQAVEQAMR